MHYLIPSFVSAAAFGICPIIDRYTSRYVNGLTLASSRGLITGICAISVFLIIKILRHNQLEKGVEERGSVILLLILVSGMIGFLMGHLGFYLALSSARSSVIQILLISHCVPLIIVTILAKLVYGDKISPQMGVGIILTIIGITLTVMYNPNHIN
jgi:drug/metabolite transporter (DMT)-like permease